MTNSLERQPRSYLARAKHSFVAALSAAYLLLTPINAYAAGGPDRNCKGPDIVTTPRFAIRSDITRFKDIITTEFKPDFDPDFWPYLQVLDEDSAAKDPTRSFYASKTRVGCPSLSTSTNPVESNSYIFKFIDPPEAPPSITIFDIKDRSGRIIATHSVFQFNHRGQLATPPVDGDFTNIELTEIADYVLKLPKLIWTPKRNPYFQLFNSTRELGIQSTLQLNGYTKTYQFTYSGKLDIFNW